MAVVAVTDHVFPDLDQERSMLAEAGHELRFEGNASSPTRCAGRSAAPTRCSTATRRSPATHRRARGVPYHRALRHRARHDRRRRRRPRPASSSRMCPTTASTRSRTTRSRSSWRSAAVWCDSTGRCTTGAWSPMDAAPLHRSAVGRSGSSGSAGSRERSRRRPRPSAIRSGRSIRSCRDEDIAAAGAEPMDLETAARRCRRDLAACAAHRGDPAPDRGGGARGDVRMTRCS